MREIKFRAWSPSENAMSKAYLLSELMNMMLPPAPSDMVMLQFTGLKDKNGKEIYEGDIVRIKQYSLEVKWEEIGWLPFSGATGMIIDGDCIMFGAPITYEIIGNIYENPDLPK